MEKNLLKQGLIKVFCGIVLVAFLLFIPAGTVNYWQAWLLLGILFIPMIAAGFILYFKNPELLKKRLNAKESQKEQKLVIALSAVMFIAIFVVAGLNFKYNWGTFSDWVCYLGAGIFLLGYGLYGEVIRENEYLSRTIEVQEGQKVIQTGLYGIVRHPMYMTTLLIFLAMPVVLGSVFSLLISLVYIPIICFRIVNEEKVLTAELEGYAEYKRVIKHRLIPFIW